MKSFAAGLGALAAIAVFTGFAAWGASAQPPGAGDPVEGAPRYDAQGKLLPVGDYRGWVFLSAGLDMSYTDDPAMAGRHSFDNVFAPRAAYETFKRTGAWPDKTVLILEVREARSKGSINRQGQFQTGQVTGVEAHVKDTARFKGGWGFFALGTSGAPAAQIPYAAACYACHQTHAAADTTFVQFYPTLLPVATRLGTLNPSYVVENTAPAK